MHLLVVQKVQKTVLEQTNVEVQPLEWPLKAGSNLLWQNAQLYKRNEYFVSLFLCLSAIHYANTSISDPIKWFTALPEHAQLSTLSSGWKWISYMMCLCLLSSDTPYIQVVEPKN